MVAYAGAVTRYFVPLLLAVLLISACGKDDDDSAVVYQQPGEKITVVIGKRFAVELAANPTTGYSWQLASDPGGAVRLVDEDYTATGTQQPGSGGVQRFTFEGASAGSATLDFAYVRPWEKDAAPAQTASYPVTVT